VSPTGSGVVHVQFIAYGLLGSLATLDGGNVTVGNAWAPTAKLGTALSELNTLVGTSAQACGSRVRGTREPFPHGVRM
jgi:hypothetical protein